MPRTGAASVDVAVQCRGVVDDDAPAARGQTPARWRVARNRLAASREVPASWARSACVERTTTSAGWSGAASPPGACPSRPARPARPRRGSRPSGTTGARCGHSPHEASRRAPARSFTAISGCSFSSRLRSPARIATARRRDRLHRGRAHLPAEHRQLAEDLAGADVGERDRAPVGVLTGDARLPALQHVTGVAGVALAQDDRAGRIVARHRDAGNLLQLRLRQLREQRHAPQQLGGRAGASRMPAWWPFAGEYYRADPGLVRTRPSRLRSATARRARCPTKRRVPPGGRGQG